MKETILTDEVAAACIPKRKQGGNKGDFGRLLNIGGCTSMCGAMLLSTLSALRSGVGLVEVAVVKPLLPVLQSRIPECIYLPLEPTPGGRIHQNNFTSLTDAQQSCSAVLFGCGLSQDGTVILARQFIATLQCPAVIDADGINCIAQKPEVLLQAEGPLILTPHVREMSRLTGLSVSEIKANPTGIALDFAIEYDATVVLKDSTTVIAAPTGELCIHDGDNSGLSKGGSGDVLSGVIASFLAQGAAPIAAAAAGVRLHALAGKFAARDFTPYAMLPSDVIAYFPQAFQQILTTGGTTL